MALRLTLVAHAATLAQKRGCFAADDPVEIDWQAQALRFSDVAGRRARFVHAPEQRAVQTAALFSAQSQCDEHLRDCDFGRWKGKSIDEVEQSEPAALSQWLSDLHAVPHGGESVAQMCQRVSEWMDSLTGTGHVVAITHPLLMRAALMRVLQCPAAAFHAIDVEPLSTLDLRFNGMWRMRTLSLN